MKQHIVDINELHIILFRECELCKKPSNTAKVHLQIEGKQFYIRKWVFSCKNCIFANTKKEDRDFILDAWKIQYKTIKYNLAKDYLAKLEKRYDNRKILQILRLLLDVQGFNNHKDFLNAIIYFYNYKKLGFSYFHCIRNQIRKFKNKRIREIKYATSSDSIRTFHTSKTSEYHLGAGSCGFP